MWHIHYDSASRDCDGLYERSWDDFRAHESDNEIDQFERALTYIGHFSPEYGQTIEIKKTDEGRTVIYGSMETDEGFSAKSATICDDESCEPEEPSFRDHTAEAAGY